MLTAPARQRPRFQGEMHPGAGRRVRTTATNSWLTVANADYLNLTQATFAAWFKTTNAQERLILDKCGERRPARR